MAGLPFHISCLRLFALIFSDQNPRSSETVFVVASRLDFFRFAYPARASLVTILTSVTPGVATESTDVMGLRYPKDISNHLPFLLPKSPRS